MSRRLNIAYNKLCLLILLSTICYNEFFVYFWCYLAWPATSTFPTGPRVVLMFIADAQIQGYKDEPGGLQGWVQRWDSDRYLGAGYRWASSAYSPDATIFLGDLIDEGSVSTRDVFKEYSSRFHSIYPKSSSTKMIYLHGDNDIGGEGLDRVTVDKISRFDAEFGASKPVYSIGKFLDIVPVSRLTQHGTYNLTAKQDKISPARITVAVSHVPVLPLDGRFAEQVMEVVRPSVVFSAHDHRGYHYTADRGNLRMIGNVDMLTAQNPLGTFLVQTKDDITTGLAGEVHEFVIPTVSYRMGVSEMGVGLAVINEAGEVKYTTLWLPARFPLLFAYLAAAISVAGIFLLGKAVQARKMMRRRAEMQSEYRSKYQMLL